MMTPEDLSERLINFAARIGKMSDCLPESRLGRHIAGQIVKSGTSPAPNYEEACGANQLCNIVGKSIVTARGVQTNAADN